MTIRPPLRGHLPTATSKPVRVPWLHPHGIPPEATHMIQTMTAPAE